MGDIKWMEVEGDNEYGICSVAYADMHRYFPNVGTIVGYNGILKGDQVTYQGEEYTVVMVSRLGHMGLSSTGELPYTISVFPKEIRKVN